MPSRLISSLGADLRSLSVFYSYFLFSASTSLLLLGFVLIFVSGWYAFIYLIVVSYLLYRIRRDAHAAVQARAAALSQFELPVPQIITDLTDASEY